VSVQSQEIVIVYLCDRGANFPSFHDFYIGFWKCSDIVVFVVFFHFMGILRTCFIKNYFFLQCSEHTGTNSLMNCNSVTYMTCIYAAPIISCTKHIVCNLSSQMWSFITFPSIEHWYSGLLQHIWTTCSWNNKTQNTACTTFYMTRLQT
jgi:hypothetical protein